jgi:N-acetylglutamate synthase/N-acetylornithine aminotransferase
MKVIRGGITAAKGFKANGLFCGIKKSRKKDLMLLSSETEAKCVGLFTTNKLKASCVHFNIKQKLKPHSIIDITSPCLIGFDMASKFLQ